MTPYILKELVADELLSVHERYAEAVAALEGELAALKGRSVTRAAVLTPHEDTLNERFRNILESEGVKVVALRGIGLRPAFEISFITDYDVHRHLLQLTRETGDESDGVYMTCGRWPSINRLWELEEVTGKPVMSSSQTWIWSTLSRLGIRPRAGRWGSLFDGDSAVLDQVAAHYVSPCGASA